MSETRRMKASELGWAPRVPEHWDVAKIVRAGDLAINTMWAWMGALGVSPCDGIVSPSYNVYRFRRGAQCDGAYFDMLFRTPLYVAEINRYSTGIWVSRLRLYPEAFLGMVTAVPPLDEQRAIVNRVRDLVARDQQLTHLATATIDRLREYRQALITAAVTGQFDVSDEHAVAAQDERVDAG